MKPPERNCWEAAIDFSLALIVVLESIPCIPALTLLFTSDGVTAGLALQHFSSRQKDCSAILIAIRRERFSDDGLTEGI